MDRVPNDKNETIWLQEEITTDNFETVNSKHRTKHLCNRSLKKNLLFQKDKCLLTFCSAAYYYNWISNTNNKFVYSSAAEDQSHLPVMKSPRDVAVLQSHLMAGIRKGNSKASAKNIGAKY